MTARTLITTPFGFESTAAEVVTGIDLSGKRAIVTGASSGIGVETARALAGAGAEVTLAVRRIPTPGSGPLPTSPPHRQHRPRCRPTRSRRSGVGRRFHGGLERAVAPPRQQRGCDGVARSPADPGRLGDAVRNQPLGSFRPRARPARRSRRCGRRADRVVELFRGHLRSPVVFDDLNFTSPSLRPVACLRTVQDRQRPVRGGGDATLGWGRHHRQRRSSGRNADTNLSRHMDPQVLADLRTSGGTTGTRLPEQGAATSVLVATSPQVESIGGRYFEDCNEATSWKPPTRTPKPVSPPTRSIRTTPSASGRSRCRCWETR